MSQADKSSGNAKSGGNSTELPQALACGLKINPTHGFSQINITKFEAFESCIIFYLSEEEETIVRWIPSPKPRGTLA